VIGGPRYLVQRSVNGFVWITKGSRPEHDQACSLASQLANRGEKGEMFRVWDTDARAEVFTVENPP
jgi:hypothetical protein